MLVRLTSKQSGTEEQKNQDEQVREAPATSGEVEDPAPSTSAQVLPRIAESVVPVEVGPREGQPSESGQDRDYGLHGESAKTHERRRFCDADDEDCAADSEGQKRVSVFSNES